MFKIIMRLGIMYLLIISALPSHPADLKLNFKTGDRIKITIRGDFSTYVNSEYSGFRNRELRGIFEFIKDRHLNASGYLYNLDKTIINNNDSGYYLDSVEKCDFTMDNNGKILFSSDNYTFPLISGVPFYPDSKFKSGEIIDSTGDAVFSFDENHRNIRLTIVSFTKYAGRKMWGGNEYDHFKIEYGYAKPDDDRLKKAIGYHKIDFFYDSQKGIPVYMEDHFTDEFTVTGNTNIKRRGFLLYFYSIVPRMDRDNTIRDLSKNEDIEKNDMTIEKKNGGIAIIIQNLGFKPDSTELLEEDKGKLLTLYDMLKKIKGKTFLITGHTAKSGTESEQMKLSLERAKAVANFLAATGIEPERMIISGKGAGDPIAPNDTEENMKKNRRVEIIIMDD